MTGFRISEATQRLAPGQPFALESGAVLPGVEIAYRTWGRLNAAGDNAIVVCHALTGSADADDWWAPLFGPGRVLDPERHFIVCSNVLGGCYGTTGPASPAPDGRRWGNRFPRVTVRDQVRLQMRLADHLGIAGIRCVVGGSMGGLQALEWALLDPQRVRAVASIAAAGRHPAWCIAWSEAQRLALAADPKFRGGDYAAADPPRQGLAAARAVAMVGYRSPLSLDERFGRSVADDDFAVRRWLRHHGNALAERFDANSYLALIDAMDTHDLGRGRGGLAAALQRIRQPVLVGSVLTDALYVPPEQRSLVAWLPHGELFEIASRHGHDGFLIDADAVELALRRFLGAQSAPAPQPAPDVRLDAGYGYAC